MVAVVVVAVVDAAVAVTAGKPPRVASPSISVAERAAHLRFWRLAPADRARVARIEAAGVPKPHRVYVTSQAVISNI